PQGVLPHPDGSVWIADSGNNRVRIVAMDGTISTFAVLGGVRSLAFTRFGEILIGADFGVWRVTDTGLLPAAGTGEFLRLRSGRSSFLISIAWRKLVTRMRSPAL